MFKMRKRKMTNFTMIPNAVLNCPYLSDKGRSLYCLLHSKADFEYGNLYLTNETMEEVLGISIQQIRKYLRELEGFELIKRKYWKENGKVKGVFIELFNEPMIDDRKKTEIMMKNIKRKKIVKERFKK